MPSIEELLAEVDKWFAEEVQHVPVNQVTEIYNQVHKAWQSLRNRLSVVVTGQPLKPPVQAPAELVAQPEAGTEAVEDPEATDGASKGSKSSKAG
jgi:hypothetical protein